MITMRYFLVLGLTIASAMIFASKAAACDCTGPRGKAALEAAHIAFRGTVTKVQYLDRDTAQNEPRIVVTFAVARVWKGPANRKLVLHTFYNKYSCGGFYFKKGKEYLVFAYRNDANTAKRFPGAGNTLGTGICTGTNLIESAQDDLRELGKGRRPS